MSSKYCTQSQVEDVFGVENVKQWSILDGGDVTNTARITRAIDVASERIDDNARISNLTVPLKDQDDAFSVTIVDLAATLAGIWLYDARGSQDFNPVTGDVVHRLVFKQQRAEQTLDDIFKQRIRIKAE